MNAGLAGYSDAHEAVASPERRGYVAELSRDWGQIERDWLGAGTGFQRSTWLSTWYEAVATGKDLEPLLVTLRDATTREVALRLPLVLREQDGLKVVEFADLNLTDFNAPLLGPAARDDRMAAISALQAVRRVLPKADLLRLIKMPLDLGPDRNPLIRHPGVVASALNGNVIHLGEDYDAWRHSLGRTYRKELERSWRVFTRAKSARFERITDPVDARHIMATLERQQGERMRELGNEYVLDDPDFSRFYGNLVERGVVDGSVVVTALRTDDEMIAAIVGVLGPTGFVFIRISNAGPEWSACSPGRLIIERTVAHLHAQGLRVFDFSIGDYDYKRRFGATRLPLYDYVAPLSWKGVKAAGRAQAVGRLRKYPIVDTKLREMQTKLGRYLTSSR